MKRLIAAIAALLIAQLSLAAVLTPTRTAIDAYKGTTKIGTGFASEADCEAFLLTKPLGTGYKCRKDVTFKVTADPAPAPTPTPTPAPTPGLPAGVTTATVLPAGYAQCGVEDYAAPQTCQSTGPVYYGAGSAWHVRAGPVACNNAAFGDPAEGQLKACHQASAAPTPTPVPTPTPEPPSGTAPGPRVSSFTASGPITATSGQVISGVRISNAGAPCITIPAGATGVVVRDSDIGPCGGSANIVVYGSGAVIEHVFVHNGNRGVLAQSTSGVVTRLSKFDTFYGPKYNGTAIEYDYMASGEIDRNVVTGSNYASDAVSVYASSNIRLTRNTINIHVDEGSAAGFTMGDASNGALPGRDNYVAFNVVRQYGKGVPAGVFGSSGNTVLEKNCLTAGIQAYNYSGVFEGVTVRDNVINMAASFVPVTSIIAGWSTNIDSTDCSRLPQ